MHTIILWDVKVKIFESVNDGSGHPPIINFTGIPFNIVPIAYPQQLLPIMANLF